MKTIEKFNVQHLKKFLKENNASKTGNKSELLIRLAEILQEENIDPIPTRKKNINRSLKFDLKTVFH